MKAFKAPVADILFSLEHVANASALPGWDPDLASEIVTQFARFAETELAPLNESGDHEGCRLDNGRVKTPKGFKQAFEKFAEQGWASLTVPEQYGGQGLPTPILGAVSEIFTGANHAFQIIVELTPGTVAALVRHGTEEQRQRYLPLLAQGRWLGTMCLTEPNAGSDLSAIRTRAEADGKGWRITGEKIFITGGDQDVSESILHLVLARTGTAEQGNKGLSLLACPMLKHDGTRNSVEVARLEEKMGIHASPTCQLMFEGAEAELIGQEGQGLALMFTMMNHARLDVALEGVAHAARAADMAAHYANERRQGRRPGTDGPALIAQHPDVARMLTEQDALALGGRAMCQIAQVTLERGDNGELVDFLTPIAKVFCTEAGIKSADLGIQILGGYGYLREFGLEQVLRDARITAIYEGANGIHAVSLVTRMLTHNNGAAAEAFEDWARTIAHKTPQSEGLLASLGLWRDLRDTAIQSDHPEEMAHAFMQLSGLVAYQAAWQLIVQNLEHAPEPDRLRQRAAFVRHTAPAAAHYWAVVAH